MEMVAAEGFVVGNADITVVCQRPRLVPHVPAMGEALAAVCQVAPAAINIKATTTEGMGFTGRMEGIACHAVVLLQQQRE
jgi:2-C-methyl-D-erythritol 2,4-cyclodiphosphate synthase